MDEVVNKSCVRFYLLLLYLLQYLQIIKLLII